MICYNIVLLVQFFYLYLDKYINVYLFRHNIMEDIKNICVKYGCPTDEDIEFYTLIFDLEGSLQDLLAELHTDYKIESITLDDDSIDVVLTPGNISIVIFIDPMQIHKIFSDDFNKLKYIHGALYKNTVMLDYSGGSIKYANDPNLAIDVKQYPYHYMIYSGDDDNDSWTSVYCKEQHDNNMSICEVLSMPNVRISYYQYHVKPVYPKNILVYECTYQQLSEVLELLPREIVVKNPIIEDKIVLLYTCSVKSITIDHPITKHVAVQLLKNPQIIKLDIICADDLSKQIESNVSLIKFRQRDPLNKHDYKYDYTNILLRNWKITRIVTKPAHKV